MVNWKSNVTLLSETSGKKQFQQASIEVILIVVVLQLPVNVWTYKCLWNKILADSFLRSVQSQSNWSKVVCITGYNCE